LWSERKAANRVLMLQTTSGYQEADLIAQTVKNQHQLKPDSTIATLYRTHFQSRIIEEALLKQSIPYKIVGGIQFYERKEIKDLLAYLKVILNPYDKVSFGRIYNCPPRKLGAQFAEQFFEAWAQEPFLNYMQISEKLIQSQALGNAQATNLTSLVKLLANFTAATAPAVAIQKIIELVGYTDYLKDGYATEEAQAKIDNIRELIRAAKHFEQEGLTTITQFIEEITLMQDKLSDQSQSTPHVQLMSLHAAKGLEFDTVIIAGLEEGLLPSTRSMNSSEQLEEERRLLYVGITRAREHLLLIHAKARSTYGQTSEQTPSRFAHEISGQVSQKLDCTYLSLFQVSDLIGQFLKNQPLGKVTPVSSAPTRSFSSSKPAPKLNSFTAYKPRAQETTSGSVNPNPTNWRINQPVQHAVFGVGLIQKIEPKATGSVLTIRFKIGVKKIDDKFIQKS
jgi:DNA helicase-2/ATP-dependent DNA helicase PcrA